MPAPRTQTQAREAALRADLERYVAGMRKPPALAGAIQNLPSSAWNAAKEFAGSLAKPTAEDQAGMAKGFYTVGKGAYDYLTGADSPERQAATEMARNMWEPWSTPEKATQTIVQDPVGALAGVILPEGKMGKMAEVLGETGKVGKLGRIATGEPAKIRAFHGSPHDFDRFDLGRIGTGEGAQAYGHGLYFAENEDVARQYKGLGSRRNLDYRVEGGGQIPAWIAQRIENGESPDTYIKDFKARIGEAEERVASEAPQWWLDKERIPGLQSIVQDLERLKTGSKAKAPEHMYEVEINADPAQFLDWDAPLSQQGDVGRRTISAIPDPSGVLGDYDSIYKRALDAGMTPADAADYAKSQAYEATGAHVMGALGRNNPKTTELLREQGIPGIKYLDQGSRDPVKMKELADDLAQYREAAKHWEATGNTEKLKIANGQIAALEKRLSRTRNYVVFDDKLISIVKKYGIAGALTAGAISQMQADQLTEQGYH